MADDRNVGDSFTTLQVTTIADPKLMNENNGNENYIRSGESVKYTLKPLTRAYASTAR